MRSHIDRRIMAAYSADLCSAEEVREIQAHLAVCATCRRRHAVLTAAVDGVSPVVLPHPAVRDRLVRAWRERHAAAATVPSRPRMGWLVPVGAAAVLVLLVTGAILYTRFESDARGEPYPLIIAAMRGTVQSSGREVRAGQRIASGAASSFTLTIGSSYRLDCGENTGVEIISADSVHGLRIRLNAGTIVSTAQGFTRYGYYAAGYELVPAGTRFLITGADAQMMAVVREGAVTVRAPGKADVLIGAGQSWSSDTSAVMPVADSALARFFGEAPAGADHGQTNGEPASTRSAGVSDNAASDTASMQREDSRRDRERDELLRDRREQLRDRDDTRSEMRRQRRRGD